MLLPRATGLLLLSSSAPGTRLFSSLPPPSSVLIQGASRGIGLSLAEYYAGLPTTEKIYCSARDPAGSAGLTDLAGRHPGRVVPVQLDVSDPASVDAAFSLVSASSPRLHMVLNVAGVLQDEPRGIVPERNAAAFDASSAAAAFQVNAFGPMLMAGKFLPLLSPKRKSEDERPGLFVSFSARVGSTTDNGLGGWHTYRASKAAANSFMKTVSLEAGRKSVAVVSVHPGTVDTDLTRAFLKARGKYDVQELGEAGRNLGRMFDGMDASWNGRFVDHKGEDVPF
ncbi:hypothetical protein TeGR_g13286 [Tetraparma gracilis]|uniref:Uncharacterized protein n=1 Tax=Tetraparma gracilis TaxID=2962635 RepID=A0ABQ6MBH5_9STRA|nr:hypothetical protein TeGR_g13286 [Tetraparma gracilis]